MKSIGVVTDSHSGICREEANRLGIWVLPMPFYIDGECYHEDVTLTREQFYEKLNSDADILTSQPSPADVTEIWDRALGECEQIIYIPISSGLSGSAPPRWRWRKKNHIKAECLSWTTGVFLRRCTGLSLTRWS